MSRQAITEGIPVRDLTKVDFWKCPYYARAMLEIIERTRQLGLAGSPDWAGRRRGGEACSARAWDDPGRWKSSRWPWAS
jgi:hypothetical protein